MEILDRRKKAAGPRRVWRMTADAPFGEFVEVEAQMPERRARSPDAPPAILEAPAPVSWHESTGDLLGGVDVTDETDSMPGELFDQLFNAPDEVPASPARKPGGFASG